MRMAYQIKQRIFTNKLAKKVLFVRYFSLSRPKNAETLSYSIYNPPPGNSSSTGGIPFFVTHGLLGSKNNWNSIAKVVSKVTNRQVITFDARNHGDSPQVQKHSYDLMAEDLLHLANELNINKFTLMGHSMGGRTCMVFALRYPQFLDKVVVVDVSPVSMNSSFHNEMKNYIQALIDINFNIGRKITLSEARKIADSALRPIVPEASIRAFLLTNLAESEGNIFWKPNLPVLLQAITNIGIFPPDLLEKTFDSPALFIRGEKSPYIPESDFSGIQKLFPSANFNTIKDAGHWPHAEKVNDFLAALVPFLQS